MLIFFLIILRLNEWQVLSKLVLDRFYFRSKGSDMCIGKRQRIKHFKCQVWNCSKSISALYTDFYSEYNFLEIADLKL